jgi:hypothetical protein
MPFINQVKSGILKAGRFATATARKAGHIVHEGAKGVYRNRDLVAKGLGIASPIISAGLAGGPAGALVAGVAQAKEIKNFAGDVKRRIQGKTKGGNISEADKDRLAGVAISAGKKLLKKNIDRQAKKRLKTMAEGQSI